MTAASTSAGRDGTRLSRQRWATMATTRGSRSRTVLAWSLWLASGAMGDFGRLWFRISMRRAGLAVCAPVSVVEAVREDRCQALMPAPRYDSLCNWRPMGCLEL